MYRLLIVLNFVLFSNLLIAQVDPQVPDDSMKQMEAFDEILERFGLEDGSGFMMDTVIIKQFGDLGMHGFDEMDINKAMEDMMKMFGSEFGQSGFGDMQSFEEILKQFNFGEGGMFILPEDFQNLDSIPSLPKEKKVKTYKL